MNYAKFKILFCLAVCLTMLLAPFALDITPDGKAQAFSSRSANKPNFQVGQKPADKKHQTSWSEYGPNSDGQGQPQTTHPVPEPATMLLVGAGLASLAIFRRKIKK
jgi:hypothetical protein